MSTEPVDADADHAGAQCPECGSPCVRATLSPFGSEWTPTECNACEWTRTGNGGVRHD